MASQIELSITDHGDGVTGIGLVREPVNALSGGFLMDFASILDDLASDTSVRSVVLSSPFKVFSAGLDLKKARDFDLEQQFEIVKGLNVAFLKLFSFPKPTVVAVSGAAIAGGLFFVLASDYRVAGPKAQFGLAEVRVGADFPVGPLEIARATLTPGDLRRLMLTGRPVKADQALASGMVDEIADEGAVMDRALVVAREMAHLPPQTFASVKRQIRGAVCDRIEDAMAAGANAPEGGWFNEETKAAMSRMIG
jgi:enoyl-CoA hydratase/carnithine racemase